MCLYDLQYPMTFKSLEECVQTPISSYLAWEQNDKLTTAFAKDVNEFNGNPQG